MAKAARKGDKVDGPAIGEHNGHVAPHTGVINPSQIDNVSNSTVYVNGELAAAVGDTANVSDNCDNVIIAEPIIEGSSTVFVNGKKAARKGDKLNSHHRSQITITGECSPNVEIGD